MHSSILDELLDVVALELGYMLSSFCFVSTIRNANSTRTVPKETHLSYHRNVGTY